MPQRYYKQESKIYVLHLELSSPSLPSDFSSPKIMDKPTLQAEGHSLLGFTKPDPDTAGSPFNVIILSSVASRYWTFRA